MNTGTVSTYLVKYLTQEEEEMEEMENKKQMEKQPERRLLDSGMHRTRWKNSHQCREDGRARSRDEMELPFNDAEPSGPAGPCSRGGRLSTVPYAPLGRYRVRYRIPAPAVEGRRLKVALCTTGVNDLMGHVTVAARCGTLAGAFPLNNCGGGTGTYLVAGVGNTSMKRSLPFISASSVNLIFNV